MSKSNLQILLEQSHSELVEIIGNIESEIWSSNDTVAYREWDKATDFVFNPANGYAVYWKDASDADILKLIPIGRGIIAKIK